MIKKITIAVLIAVVAVGGYWTYQNLKGKAERARTTGAMLVDPTNTVAKPPPVPAGPMRTFKLMDVAGKTPVKWTGYKKVGQHSGWFILFDGTGKMPGNNIEQASIDLSIETDSCETDDAILTGIMKKESSIRTLYPPLIVSGTFYLYRISITFLQFSVQPSKD